MMNNEIDIKSTDSFRIVIPTDVRCRPFPLYVSPLQAAWCGGQPYLSGCHDVPQTNEILNK